MMAAQQFVKGLGNGMHAFGECIAAPFNSALLLIVYLIGVGPTALVAKIVGKRFLHTRVSKTRESYWSELDLETKPIESYYRQF